MKFSGKMYFNIRMYFKDFGFVLVNYDLSLTILKKIRIIFDSYFNLICLGG